MGLIATDITQTVEFSLAEDQGPDRTVFILRPLDMRERAFVSGRFAPGMRVRRKEDDGRPTAEMGMVTPETIIDSSLWTVRLGIRGWRAFLTRSGKPVEVQMESVSVPGVGTREALTEECVLRSFQKLWVDEICAEILKISELTGEQRKN